MSDSNPPLTKEEVATLDTSTPAVGEDSRQISPEVAAKADSTVSARAAEETEDESLGENPDSQEHELNDEASDVNDDNKDVAEEEDSSSTMPLYRYTRLLGSKRSSISEPFRQACTSSVMGKVVLNADTTQPPANSASNSLMDLYPQPLPVALFGFSNGQVLLVDVLSNHIVSEWQVREASGSGPSVVAVSLDASGTCLTALDAGGMCTVWEVRYALADPAMSATAAANNSNGDLGNVFTNFVSALTGTPSTEDPDDSTAAAPILTVASVQAHRITYPKSFGSPTCLAIDPAYRRREKAVVVGFTGRLVLTKRGLVFGRRNDQVLYQGPDAVEAVTWRGSHLVFCDATGVRLMDAEAWTRIAHIDRPAGARPSLYPTVANLKPTICFETSHLLLVGWGDCLLGLTLREEAGPAVRPDAGAATAGSAPRVRRRTVSCHMAWSVDNAIIAGLAPLDSQHVSLLVLVPDDEDKTNVVELWVFDRATGSAVYADQLPLAVDASLDSPESILPYSLLSSFAVPRMDNVSEAGPLETDFDPLQAASLFGPETKKVFRDLHLQWNLNHASFETEEKVVGTSESNSDDGDSVDSDDYEFLLRPVSEGRPKAPAASALPPVQVIISATDAVLGRTRSVDDAISHALAEGKPATALRRALRHLPGVRQYKLDDLVHAYLTAVLRLEDSEHRQPLSLRRLQLAARAMPVLIGGNVDLWGSCVTELETLPGALFVVRPYLPVRDPILPQKLYTRVLHKMLEQVEAGRQGGDAQDKTLSTADGHLLDTLIAWGPTKVLKEFVKLFEYQVDLDTKCEPLLVGARDSLHRRLEQTAAGYLVLPSDPETSLSNVQTPSQPAEADDSANGLFDVKTMVETVLRRVPLFQAESRADGNTPVALDALARLYMMQGNMEDALRCFLAVGALHSLRTQEQVEDDAMATISGEALSKQVPSRAFVLHFIQTHSLHQCLVDPSFLPDSIRMPPLFALVRLVGLDMASDFLMPHLVPPEYALAATAKSPFTSGSADRTLDERRESLPLDRVAAQLETSPKLYFWYLHTVFLKRPDIYVKFPNTAHPPPVISNLHRKHLDLLIKFAGKYRDSARILEGMEAYRVTEMTTPLLSLMKNVLQLGGVNSAEVGKLIEVERRGSAGSPGTFALELAYLMEHYGDKTEADSKTVLELYLSGARSLMLAVSFAQRTREYSTVLWQTLIDYCLEGGSSNQSPTSEKVDGTLFGSLLEAAALSGADLAYLVKQIPHGMSIEGLRPRLVAAVSDYRWKLQMHESSAAIARTDKVSLIREVEHRSRRAMRFEMEMPPMAEEEKRLVPNASEAPEGNILPVTMRTKERLDRYTLAYSLAIR